MADFSFSRAGLTELTEEFSANLKATKETFDAVKKEFTEINEKWTGGDSENATAIFTKINNSLNNIAGDLDNADRFIKEKADAFNSLHFRAS